MDYFKILRKLTETTGPSGYEHRIGEVISELWTPFSDHITIDRVGSVIALCPGIGMEPRPRLLLAAHMDEIGLMVTKIEPYNDYGFLRVTNVGGVDIRHLYGQRVIVHGQQDLPAVIGSLPVKMLDKEIRTQPYGYQTLLIDPGLPFDTLQKQVAVGDFVSFDQPLRKLLGKNVAGKALDNRASVAAVTACLDFLAQRKHMWDIVAVATVQEETRLLGAYTSAFSQLPDAAVALDVIFAKGAAFADASAVELDSGPVLDIGPNVHPGVFRALHDAAEALEMNISVRTHSRASGTDAYGLQVARSGIPTALVSIPLRYMHTMVETINTQDIKRTGRLLAEFITRLDDDFVLNLAKGMMEE